MKELSCTERKRIVSRQSGAMVSYRWGSKRTVDLGAGIYNALCMMGESRKMHAVLLTLQLLCMLPLLAIVYLERLVVAGYDGQFTSVVKVERSH